MSEFINLSSKEIVIGENAFKKLFPNTSIPFPITEEIAQGLGYSIVFSSRHPATNSPYEVVVRDGVELIEEKYYEKWKVTTVSSEQQKVIDGKKAEFVRNERNAKLSETDHLALSDVTLSDQMKKYRQDLRDLPAAHGDSWPHNVSWPTKP